MDAGGICQIRIVGTHRFFDSPLRVMRSPLSIVRVLFSQVLELGVLAEPGSSMWRSAGNESSKNRTAWLLNSTGRMKFYPSIQFLECRPIGQVVKPMSFLCLRLCAVLCVSLLVHRNLPQMGREGMQPTESSRILTLQYSKYTKIWYLIERLLIADDCD
jgi:hypothetical protein